MQGCKYLRVSPIHTRRDEAHLPHTHTHTHTRMYMKGEFLDVPFPFTESLGDKRNLLFSCMTGEFSDTNSPFPFAESLGDTRNFRELRATHKADMQYRGKVCVCVLGARETHDGC